MNRRGFLSLLGLGAAGLVLDPERLLWVPGQKSIFLPSVQTYAASPNLGVIVAAAWEEALARRVDSPFENDWLFHALSRPMAASGEARVAYA